MKAKIKIKVLTEGCMPKIINEGEWIDLIAAEDVEIDAPQCGTAYKLEGKQYRNVEIPVKYIPLGVAMKLPDGYEAIVAPRSSTPGKKRVFEANSIGVIDNSYSGNDDQWCLIASPLSKAYIKKGDKVCQFRIQLSQKATFWQKIKWLFSSGIELVEVDNISDNNRGGFGTTGV